MACSSHVYANIFTPARTRVRVRERREIFSNPKFTRALVIRARVSHFTFFSSALQSRLLRYRPISTMQWIATLRSPIKRAPPRRHNILLLLLLHY